MTERSPIVPAAEMSGMELLRLGRADREGAKRRLREFGPEIQAQACRELRPGLRNEFLMLVDDPEKVVPLLPEAELVHTIRGGGMSEGAWLLEIATPEQRAACIDLDCWDGAELNLERVEEWIDALIEAGRPTLGRALDEIDLGVWILALLHEAEVVVVGKEDEPPTGYFTPDGVVYFGVPEEATPHRVHEMVHAAWERDQSIYWRLTYGALFELPSGCEEDALRWRNNRLQDLGFPDRDQAMRVYRPLRVEAVQSWTQSSDEDALVERFDVPRQLQGTLISEALAELPAQRAGDVLGYILAVANSIAVADKLPLADPDSIPAALKKAVAGIEAGLRELARQRGLAPRDVLDGVVPLELFRVGVTSDPSLR